MYALPCFGLYEELMTSKSDSQIHLLPDISSEKRRWESQKKILHPYRSKTFDIFRLIGKFRSLQIGKWYSSLVINPAQLATVSDLGQTQIHKYLHTLHKYLHYTSTYMHYIHTMRCDEGRIIGSTGVWDNDYWELGNYWIFRGDFLWDFYNWNFTSIPPMRSIWRKGFITNEFIGPS